MGLHGEGSCKLCSLFIVYVMFVQTKMMCAAPYNIHRLVCDLCMYRKIPINSNNCNL